MDDGGQLPEDAAGQHADGMRRRELNEPASAREYEFRRLPSREPRCIRCQVRGSECRPSAIGKVKLREHISDTLVHVPAAAGEECRLEAPLT